MVNSNDFTIPTNNMQELTVNCYPNCSEEEIVKNLLKRNPCIDIGVVHTDTLFQWRSGYHTGKNIIDSIIKFFQEQTVKYTDKGTKEQEFGADTAIFNLTSNSLNFEDGSNINNIKKKSQTDQFGRFEDIYGFLSLLSGNTVIIFKNIPICSSPNISVTHGAGFENEQSLFSFIQSAINTGGKILGGASGLLGGITGALEWFTGLFGVSPRLSPYFSFKANPFSATPSLSVEIKLINDSNKSLKDNNAFLNEVIRNSLIRSSTFSQFGTSTTGSIWNRWVPPRLFNVSLKFGCDGNVVKRFHLCKLTSTVTAEGLVRKKNRIGTFPDAYSVTLNFQSILPDTGDTWSDADAWELTGATQTRDSMINQEQVILWDDYINKIYNELNATNYGDIYFENSWRKLAIENGMTSIEQIEEYVKVRRDYSRLIQNKNAVNWISQAEMESTIQQENKIQRNGKR